MSILEKKIDFAVILSVHNANPNGDPLTGNRPREDFNSHGEISDVCLKRKIRNRLMDFGLPVFVQSDDKCSDGCKSLQDRTKACPELKKIKDPDEYARVACEQWMDVRSFGQVFAFKGDDLSVGVRGPVSLHPAVSVDPVDIISTQITKSVNSATTKDGKKSSDTMGMKHRVAFGLYVFYGSINCQLAEKTEFSDEDAEQIKQALITLFENDASSARPDGSMEINQVYWWEHSCKSGQYSSAKVHRTLTVQRKPDISIPQSIDDYEITLDSLPGLEPEVYEGK